MSEETPQTQAIPTNDKLTKGHILAACRNQGISIPDASNILGIHPNYGYAIAKKLSKQDNLTSKTFVRLASKAVKAMVQGKPIGDVESVRDSTVLQAAKMVYDRVQPTEQQAMAGSNITFIQVNLDGYK